MSNPAEQIRISLDEIDGAIQDYRPQIETREIGTVRSIGRGVAEITGLNSVRNDEVVRFPNQQLGMVFNLDQDSIGCILLDHAKSLKVGDAVQRTYRELDVPVGEELLGRVIDPVGRPLDGKGELVTGNRLPVERIAPAILARNPVSVPLQTGIKVIDALVPIGRGQRQLIVGDRQTGKTSVAVDAIINQLDQDVICIYCAVGQRSSAVASVVNQFERSGVLKKTVVVVGESNATPGLQFVAPYAATSIGEHFMEQGQDVLIVYDELTAHAKVHREISLLLRRPPGREAYPGDIFYIHARLLERATCLRRAGDSPGQSGGSITALPVVETESQNVSAYIPTNLISITDGQVYLSPDRFRKGILPAVDVGRSVSRVGGKAQLPAYRTVTGPLRLTYSQFEELEKFARFSSQLDEATRKKLVRGRRVRQLLQQKAGELIDVVGQIAAFVALTRGLFDELELAELDLAEKRIVENMNSQHPEMCRSIIDGNRLSESDLIEIIDLASDVVEEMRDQSVRTESGVD